MQLTEELNATLELDEVLRKVAEKVKQRLHFDTFAILLLDPMGKELHIRFGLGYPPEVIEGWRFGLGQGIVGTVAKTGEPVRVEEVTKDARYINAEEGIRSELAVPLMVKSRTIGVLDLGSRRPHYFTQSHQRLLTLVAERIASAIENARLYETVREHARTLSLLNEVSRDLTSILDWEELLCRIAQQVKRLIDYQLFSVLLWNEETQRLEDTFSRCYDQRFSQKTGVPLGYGICGTVAALRQALRVPNVHLDPRYVRCDHDVEVRSELAVPLLFKDRLIGVVDLESVEYNAFSEQHEQMLSTLASYVAIALENARLYEKLREEEQRLENDLDTAREIQKGLLPEVAPRVPGLQVAFGYEPARQLGGDFYDFLPYGQDRLAIAVGDVAGKATPAALYGSLAIGILRSLVVAHPGQPKEMLELMNEHLRQPRIDNRFVAMAFGIYDNHTKSLTMANSGFPRPLLVRGAQVQEIQVEGIPLGMLPNTQYDQKTLILEDGDVVVFCSDGLHESMNKHEEEYGSERLQNLAKELSTGSAQEIADGLLRTTARHSAGNGHEADDRTVVVLKVTPD